MIKAIIIEDEQQARVALKHEINHYCPDLEIVAEADSVSSGITAIQNNPSNLIFLDIQLTDGVGFDILEAVQPLDAKVIFTTAYSEYALRAIKFSALDYLLKPIDGEELAAAVGKVRQEQSADYQRQINNLLQFHRQKDQHKRIALATSDGIHLYELRNIIRCSSEGNYTNIFFTNKRKLLVAKTLKELEELLSPFDFERIHKSHIINLDHLESYLNKDNGYVVLSDGTSISVSQRKKPQLLAVLNGFNKKY